VLPSTAGHPPPSERSSTMGRVSLTMTLANKSVTKTQCFPLFKSLNTLCACFCSLPSPEVAMTCRYIPSCPIKLQSKYILAWIFANSVTISVPTYAIVSPANAPPDITNINATVKYSHRSGSSGLLGKSSWPLIQLVNGAAPATDIWEAARNKTLARPTTAGRVPPGETLYLELCDRIVIVDARGLNSVGSIAGVALFPLSSHRPIRPN
jgi:hypothetical protein